MEGRYFLLKLIIICYSTFQGDCETVGKYLNPGEQSGTNGSGVVVIDTSEYRFDEDGTVTSFTIDVNLPDTQANTPSSVSLLILRPISDRYRVVAISEQLESPWQFTQSYQASVNPPITAKQGDVIGFSYQGLNPVSYSEDETCSVSGSFEHAMLYADVIPYERSELYYGIPTCYEFSISVEHDAGVPFCDDPYCECIPAVTDETGDIYSPNYPSGYGTWSSTRCWLIYTDSQDKTIELLLEELNTEGSAFSSYGTYQCHQDFITVYSGSDSDGESEICWSGNYDDQSILSAKSEGQYMYITWTQDFSVGNGNWKLSYRAVEKKQTNTSIKTEGLSGGAIAGIVVGSIVGVVIIVVLCCCCCQKGKKKNKTSSEPAQKAAATTVTFGKQPAQQPRNSDQPKPSGAAAAKVQPQPVPHGQAANPKQYPPNNQGYPPGSQGYPPGSQGYPPGGQGYPPSSQGAAAGYPPPTNQNYPPPFNPNPPPSTFHQQPPPPGGPPGASPQYQQPAPPPPPGAAPPAYGAFPATDPMPPASGGGINPGNNAAPGPAPGPASGPVSTSEVSASYSTSSQHDATFSGVASAPSADQLYGSESTAPQASAPAQA